MNCIIACFPISPFLSNEKLFRCSILEVGELLDAKRRGTHKGSYRFHRLVTPASLLLLIS